MHIQQPNLSLDFPKKKRGRVTYLEWIFIGIVFIAGSFFGFNWLMNVLIHHRAEVRVPDLTGGSIMYALDQLATMQIGLMKESEEFNQSLPAGSILRQTPIPGTKVREGKTIRVVISKGGEKVFVPDLVNKPLRLAEIDLRQTNLDLGEVAEQYSLITEKGSIIRQDPEVGAVADRHTLIHLVISSGKPPKDINLIPDFVERSIEKVMSWSKDHDVAIDHITPDPYSAVSSGIVIQQYPEPDTIIDGSQEISFIVGVSTIIASANRVFRYALPQGVGKRTVIVRQVHGDTEHLIFKGKKLPGSKLEIPYFNITDARIEVYLDGIMLEGLRP